MRRIPHLTTRADVHRAFGYVLTLLVPQKLSRGDVIKLVPRLFTTSPVVPIPDMYCVMVYTLQHIAGLYVPP
jgi:hypothetical protein